MRRRRRDNTLNLFAFQDIITGVAGVMLFVLLLLVVHMTLRTATAATEFGGPIEPPQPPPAEPEPDQRQQLMELQNELERLRKRGAELLRADTGDLDEKIRKAEAEFDELMREAAEQKSQAESIASQMSSQETSQQKMSTLQRRNALKRRLQDLEEEEVRHASGKLVAFKAASAGMRELWLIDMRGTRAEIFNVESPGDAVVVTYEKYEPPYAIVQSIRGKLQEQTKVRSIVVLLRPSIAGTGSELLDAFRRGGFQVALEILDDETIVAPPSQRAQR